MFEEFAGKGSVVKFLGKNGHDYQLEEALRHFTEGQFLIVKDTHISDWNSVYLFEGIKGKFNTVMFEVVEKKPVLLEYWEVRDNRMYGILANNGFKSSEIQELLEDRVITRNSTYYLGQRRQ